MCTTGTWMMQHGSPGQMPMPLTNAKDQTLLTNESIEGIWQHASATFTFSEQWLSDCSQMEHFPSPSTSLTTALRTAVKRATAQRLFTESRSQSEYKESYGQVYNSDVDNVAHEVSNNVNGEHIVEHNAKSETFQLGSTQSSDLCQKEYWTAAGHSFTASADMHTTT